MKAHICGWFRPSSSPTRLCIRSEAYRLETHYVPKLGSARCQVAGCRLCEHYGPPRETTVHVVERAGQLFLLELNAGALDRALVVGDSVVIHRRKLADYAETFLRRDGFDSVEAVPATAYLAAIGQRVYDRAVGELG